MSPTAQRRKDHHRRLGSQSFNASPSLLKEIHEFRWLGCWNRTAVLEGDERDRDGVLVWVFSPTREIEGERWEWERERERAKRRRISGGSFHVFFFFFFYFYFYFNNLTLIQSYSLSPLTFVFIFYSLSFNQWIYGHYNRNHFSWHRKNAIVAFL